MTVPDPSVLLIERSACGVSVSVSLAELLFGLGSTAPSGMPTVAVLVIVPVADGSGVTVKLNVAVPPFSKLTVVEMLPVPVAAEQTEPADGVHVHEALVSTAGSVSVTGTPNTSFGPLFFTTMT